MFPTRLRSSDRPDARILPTKPPRYKPLHLNYLTRFSLSCFCRDRLLRRSATSASPPLNPSSSERARRGDTNTPLSSPHSFPPALTPLSYPRSLPSHVCKIPQVVPPRARRPHRLSPLSLPPLPQFQQLQPPQTLARSRKRKLFLSPPRRPHHLPLLRHPRAALAKIPVPRRARPFLEYLRHESRRLHRPLSPRPRRRTRPPAAHLPQR